MAEVDTSSYPKATMPVSPLDMAQKFGNLQQQSLSINQQKLDQANQGLTYLTRAMSSLGPDATKDQYKEVGANAVRMGLVPPDQLKVWNERVDAAPDSKTFYNELVTAAANHQEMINYHLGQTGTVGTGQTNTPVVTSVKPGFGQRPIGLPVQQQAPPTTKVMGPNNQEQLLGAQPPQVAPGAAAGPTPLPTGPIPLSAAPARAPLPVQRPTISGPTGPSIRRTDLEPTSFDNRFPQPTGPITGTPPLFEAGKGAYVAAQSNAASRSQAIKPAIQALKLMPGLSTGPGTHQYNELVAAAKAFGIVDTKAENDPTVLRQELEKKLAQYVGGSPLGQRSDAQQALAEAGSPNPKKQILPALQNLTRDAIALERVQILLPQAFKGQDYQNFVKHQGTFPQSVDEKALTLDMLPEEDRNKLITKMASQYKNGNAGEKKIANRFLDTLKLAKEHNIYEGM